MDHSSDGIGGFAATYNSAQISLIYNVENGYRTTSVSGIGTFFFSIGSIPLQVCDHRLNTGEFSLEFFVR
jgi:hypothetical protein